MPDEFADDAVTCPTVSSAGASSRLPVISYKGTADLPRAFTVMEETLNHHNNRQTYMV